MNVTVAAGDMLRFRLNQYGTYSSDYTAVSIYITYVDTNTKTKTAYAVPGTAAQLTLSPSCWFAYNTAGTN